MNAEFDQFAPTYRQDLDHHLKLTGESSDFFAHYKVQKLASWLKNPDRKLTILDFGCGDGLMTSYVAKIYAQSKIYGVDPSGDSIEIAQKNYSSITFSINSEKNTQLDFADQFFDIVICAGAFHHIPSALHGGYMQELYRILKTGGYCVNFELNPLNPVTQYIFRHNPIDYQAKMLSPWYAKKLARTHIGSASLKFVSFFPGPLKLLRPSEPYLTWLPLGAQYAVLAQKI